jgi:hypothetical protein
VHIFRDDQFTAKALQDAIDAGDVARLQGETADLFRRCGGPAMRAPRINQPFTIIGATCPPGNHPDGGPPIRRGFLDRCGLGSSLRLRLHCSWAILATVTGNREAGMIRNGGHYATAADDGDGIPAPLPHDQDVILRGLARGAGAGSSYSR